MKKLYALLFVPFCAFAQLPDYFEYYEGVDLTLTGNALKEQLATLVTQTHTTELTYTPDVWTALEAADLDPDNPENVFLIYGYDDTDADTNNDRTRDKDDNCHTLSCSGLWVREHVFPRSLGNPNLEYAGPGADAHHLRAIDANMNSSRSNRRFADGSGHATTITGGFFYPGDEWRGDIARMMMYMYVRYGTQCEANVVGSGSSSYSPMTDMPNIFLEWNQEDPVSQYEKNRNTILQDMQGNRNPFIDNPYLATLIWNGPAAEDTWQELGLNIKETSQIVIYPTINTGIVSIQNANIEYSIRVVNPLGQRVSHKLQDNVIDITGNAPGIYLIELSDKAHIEVFKVILQ
ncbi:endonuclease [Flavobacterium akiainvivens]|uniref:endonuclease n=1 Tax=Flavobacterium akiainvivens TaxID=1202724 RepID=UPI0006C8E195|nr:endonuclease [Flavobacterium akiainvivens]SFQ46676.1 Por secretion system C-terminal sorting domain-containing protein [Flavobacterium akiainvivens]